jgi:hypothetical protein
MARERRGPRLVNVFAVLCCLAVAAVAVWFSLPTLGRARDDWRKTRCAANLHQIGQAMVMYLNTLGQNSSYSVPAEAFRGDAWLASLYWSGLIREPKVFFCPGTDDDGTIPATQAAAGDLNRGDAIPSDAISYAGRCHGTPLIHRNTPSFSKADFSGSSVMACDDSEGSKNHRDGFFVVAFEGYVDFVPEGSNGGLGCDLDYLDSGE